MKIANAYKRSFTGLSRETWLLSSVLLINRCGNMAVPFMSLYVTQSLKRPASDAGIIIALFGVGSVMGSALGGWLTDKIGFRPVQIVAAMVSGIFFLLFGAITHFPTLCCLIVIISLFSDAFRPANFTAIAFYAKKGTETRSNSLNRLAVNVGWAVGASVGGIIASYNYHLLFVVEGTISIMAGLLIVWWLPGAKELVKKAKEHAVDTVALKPWKDKVFVGFVAITCVFSSAFFLMFRVGPLYFKEYWHLDESLIGVMLGFNGVIIALFEMVLVNYIEDKRTLSFFIIAGSLVLAGSYLFLLLPGSIALLALGLSVTCFTIGEILSLPFINTFVIGRSTPANRGQYAAGYALCWSFAQVVGPASGFYLADHWSFHALWVVLSLLLVMCAYSYYRLIGRATPVRQQGYV
ncbi:multidrug resistance protein [Filimonas lacunae]|nr:multidrug resistance protein [Filimonas lacunae]